MLSLSHITDFIQHTSASNWWQKWEVFLGQVLARLVLTSKGFINLYAQWRLSQIHGMYDSERYMSVLTGPSYTVEVTDMSCIEEKYNNRVTPNLMSKNKINEMTVPSSHKILKVKIHMHFMLLFSLWILTLCGSVSWCSVEDCVYKIPALFTNAQQRCRWLLSRINTHRDKDGGCLSETFSIRDFDNFNTEFQFYFTLYRHIQYIPY